MILSVDSNTAYLVLFQAKSRIVEYFQLNDDSQHTEHPDANRAALIEFEALKNAVLSAAKAKTGRAFYNAQTEIQMRYVLQILDHKQPSVPLKTNNLIIRGFADNKIYQKGSMSQDVKYHQL